MEREKDKSDVKSHKQSLRNDMPKLISPETRLQHCFDTGKKFSFEVNNSIMRYYRSGKELIRQADVYTKEGDLEKGYILYIRCLTIFLEKLETHPEYHTIPANDKDHIKNTLKEIFPKTEALKKKLLEQYKHEYAKQKQEYEEQERIELERLRQEQQRLKEEEEERALQLNSSAHPGALKLGVAAGALTSADEFRLKRHVIPPKTYVPSQYDEQAQSSKDRKVPSVDRSTKPTSLTSGDRLRDIVVPSKLMQNFLKLAFSNTSNNIETCGILAGRLERNRLLVTHFLIPKQTGSPDSCVTHNEEDIFDFQDQHNLITLGWIHTHPTQTAFLSSVDLHTHCAYQLMMSEAIAIVCAPKYDETGFFHLTPDYGLNYIANCRETGFHPHPSEPPLFTVRHKCNHISELTYSLTAKHFILDPLAPIEAVDLRRK
ncbi:hypothetical protein TSAR_010956 [Trichomalopsis sarcophagae]|uniref:MPN domain-containing protein n=1 Tax=Trichomalopsis sarcophagae TaxID=543379 RepID=A0A232FC62_9HYME|nr:hypothetical protein TSAR_010956 [Trichomalopsis sarcophagae]